MSTEQSFEKVANLNRMRDGMLRREIDPSEIHTRLQGVVRDFKKRGAPLAWRGTNSALLRRTDKDIIHSRRSNTASPWQEHLYDGCDLNTKTFYSAIRHFLMASGLASMDSLPFSLSSRVYVNVFSNETCGDKYKLAIVLDDDGQPCGARLHYVSDFDNKSHIQFFEFKDGHIEPFASSSKLITGWLPENIDDEEFARRNTMHEVNAKPKKIGSNTPLRPSNFTTSPQVHRLREGEYALLIRAANSESPLEQLLTYSGIHSDNYGCCAALLFEGANFCMISHVSGTPSKSVPDFLIGVLENHGIKTEGIRLRLIGGDDTEIAIPMELYDRIPKDRFNIIQVDILGSKVREVGYELGPVGTYPPFFQLNGRNLNYDGDDLLW